MVTDLTPARHTFLAGWVIGREKIIYFDTKLTLTHQVKINHQHTDFNTQALHPHNQHVGVGHLLHGLAGEDKLSVIRLT